MLEEILTSIAMNTGLLMLAWIIYLLLEYCWSGMSKFVGIILLPGKILHLAAHYLFAKIFGLRAFDILKSDFTRERASMGIVVTSGAKHESYKIYITLLAPMIIAIPMLILMRWILANAIMAGSKITIIIAWMTISIFVCGMPNLSDLSFIGMYHIVNHPEVIIAFLWAPIVYALGYLAYGSEIAAIGVLIYVMLILLASFVPTGARTYVITE